VVLAWKDEERTEIKLVVSQTYAEGHRLTKVWEDFKRAHEDGKTIAKPCKYSDAVDERVKVKEEAGNDLKYIKFGKFPLLKFAEDRLD